jgi:hypothetical protein
MNTQEQPIQGAKGEEDDSTGKVEVEDDDVVC